MLLPQTLYACQECVVLQLNNQFIRICPTEAWLGHEISVTGAKSKDLSGEQARTKRPGSAGS